MQREQTERRFREVQHALNEDPLDTSSPAIDEELRPAAGADESDDERKPSATRAAAISSLPACATPCVKGEHRAARSLTLEHVAADVVAEEEAL